ncbi:MAG: MBL fold metallo-hydrolase [Bacteroidetes bacterium]|nr:MAG: MBL fold metallo-hydrolase [Bacteroidota bacterium]
MRLQTIHTGNFMLDGGAMFGTVPKSIWQRINPANESNMCNWAMRCLLVEDGNRLILIDSGMGEKQSEKFFGYYYLNGIHSLQKSLNAAGVDFGDITDVVLTHLHFDHCGGSVKWNSMKDGYDLTFPNANYWVHPDHWEHAIHPNQREKASFLTENMLPIQEHGNLKFIGQDLKISENVSGILAQGHTESMFCPKINTGNSTLMFMADMIPSVGHIRPNYVMGYDIRPLDTMRERESFLKEAVAKDYSLFFEHDLNIECGKVVMTDRGYKLGDSGLLTEFI